MRTAGSKGSSPVRHEAAAICTPGLESFCEAELKALGIKPKPGQSGVIEFRANNRQLYAANLWLRTASRVLVRIATFRATDFAHLQQRATEIDWEQWIPADHRPEFRVSTAKSRLYHTDAIAQRLHQVVGPPSIGEPTQPFVVRIDRDLVTVSVDSGGTPLNHRGWRTDLGVAPLRPTMAAAMVMASGWDGTTSLIDPFCGSGTIAIEAALLALAMPPGGDRRFAFQQWPGFEAGAWASVNGSAKAGVRSMDELAAAGVSIEANDRDASAVAACSANAERAGVVGLVQVEQRVVSHLTGADGPGLVATNPPYGKRVGDGDLRPLYKRFGAVLRERRPEWALTIVAADSRLARSIDQRLKPVTAFGHGGLKVQVFSRPGGTPAESGDPSSPEAEGPNPPAATPSPPPSP